MKEKACDTSQQAQTKQCRGKIDLEESQSRPKACQNASANIDFQPTHQLLQRQKPAWADGQIKWQKSDDSIGYTFDH